MGPPFIVAMEFGHLEGVPQPQVLGTTTIPMVTKLLSKWDDPPSGAYRVGPYNRSEWSYGAPYKRPKIDGELGWNNPTCRGYNSNPEGWQLCYDILGPYTVCSDCGWGKRGLGIRLAYHTIQKWMSWCHFQPHTFQTHNFVWGERKIIGVFSMI